LFKYINIDVMLREKCSKT